MIALSINSSQPKPMLHISTSRILKVLLTMLFFYQSSSNAYAGSGSIDTVTVDQATSGSGVSTSSSSLTSSPITQQTGLIQFNPPSYSNFGYPTCSGTCVFAITRVSPSGNGGNNLEAVAGIIYQFSSPENTQAESQRLLAIAQKERLDQESTVILAEKLSDAIESGKKERANVIAIILARRLGYPDHHQLLLDMGVKQVLFTN